MGDNRAILAAQDGDLTTLKQLHIDGTLGQAITDCLGAGLVHHASRAGRLECLKFLVLQANLPGNHRANSGATPAHDAAALGNLAVLQWLIKDGGYSMQEQDVSGASPLHLAARFGHSEAVEWLIQAGCNTAMETREGAVPTHYAAAKGHLTCLKLLVAADCSCVNKQTRSGATPLYLACQEGHLHVIQFLVKDCAAEVHLRAHDGMTVLHAAACGGHRAVVIWLVTFTDVSLTAQDEEGATALHFAAREGHTAVVDRLLLMGAEIVIDNWSRTPLHDAAENGQLECCQTLICHQVDSGIHDGEGYTAQDLAWHNGHRQCARYLQEAEKLADHQNGSNRQDAQIDKIKERTFPRSSNYHTPDIRQDCLQNQTLKDDTRNTAYSQMLQPVRLFQANVGHISGMQKENVDSALQKAPTSKTFNIVKSKESSKSPLAELKINKSLQKAKITALFSSSGEKTEPPDVIVPRPLLSMLDELGASDLDALVPTHDERGSSIPEWKRQVMVRKLQAQLVSEEGTGRKKGDCTPEMDDWQYSQAHNAILGPYGELLTEDDLLYLEKEIEKLQMRKKCQEYGSELERLTEELQTILPAPIINITVNSQFPQQSSEDGGQELPTWCNHVSGVVKSMSLLLNNVSGVKAEEKNETLAPTVFLKSSKTKRFSGGTAKREILDCGVSVRNLRGSFEKRALLGQCKPFEGHGVKAMPWEHGTSEEPTPETLSAICKGKKQLVCEEREFGDMENASDSGISCEEASSDVSGSPVSSAELTTLRKERIVILFLSHWKKSAYTPSLKLMARKTVEAPQPGKVELVEMTKVKKQPDSTQEPLVETSKLGHLVQQRYTIKNLIGHWKGIISLVPSQRIRHLSHQHAVYSPEQFLPYVNGEPAAYNSLTLDLFMLGYFHILELHLSPEERKTRHLLCFEVFDHLGRYQWETVRDFHRAVIDEIAAGKRGWADSFEDIKARYFNDNKNPVKKKGLKRSSVETNLKPVSKAIVQNVVHDPSDLELCSFTNDEICRYIDRSFAFWKEKEAEMFHHFEEPALLH